MTETVITVQGSFSARFPAERATVNVSVGFEGPKRDSVFAETTKAAESVRKSITELHDPENGPLTQWSSDRVNVWSSKPWSNDGRQLAPVFHSAIGFTARFKDFEALARWVEQLALIPGVTVNRTDWALTDGRLSSVTAEVRSRAVKDAVSKATVFAQSIGLGTVRAIAIADPGMLGDGGTGGPIPGPAGVMRIAAASDAVAAVTFKPEDIEVSSTVDARFIAS
jgi:uncharacterized protein YggE